MYQIQTQATNGIDINLCKNLETIELYFLPKELGFNKDIVHNLVFKSQSVQEFYAH